jgi:tape measure domain-containing protein
MTDFRINVIVDPSKAVSGARTVQRELDNTEDKGERLNKTLRRTFQLVGIGLAVRQLGQLADAFTNTQNRLRTVISGERELADATRTLFEISERTRSSYIGTVEVFARVGAAAKDLGVSQQELLQFTESLNQAVILSGASATEATAGLIQLSQGLASGALRGDELRSVLEQLPAVADIIAKSLGVTRGQLRKLGEEGRITAEVVLGAFKEARVELDEKFAQTVPTIGQAFVVLQNNLLQFVGELDKATGASAALAGTIIATSENLDLLAGGIAIAAATYASTLIPATLTAGTATAALTARLRFLAATLAANPFAIAVAALGGAALAAKKAGDEFDVLTKSIANAVEAGEKFALTDYGKVGADIAQVQANLARVQGEIERDLARGAAPSPAAVALAERFRRELEALGVQQGLLRDGTAKTTVEAQEQLKALEALAGATREVIASIEQENVLLQLNSREREVQAALLREVNRLQKEGGPQLTDEQKADLELAIRRNQELQDQASILDRIRGPQQQYEADLRALNQLLGAGSISQDEFNSEVERLAEAVTGVNLADLGLGAFGDQLAGIDIEGLRALVDTAARGQNVPLAPAQPNRAPGDPGLDRSSITPELQNQLDLYEQITGPQRRYLEDQAALKALFDSGAISAKQYALALNDATIYANQLGSTASTGLSAGLAQIESQLLDVGGQVQQTLVNGFSAAEDALVSFVRTGELDFSRLVDSILNDLSRLLVRQALLGLLGGGGEAGVLGFNAFGGGKAAGGPVSGGTPYLVGEEGPEIFTPKGSGNITPAGETAAIMQNAASASQQAPTVNVAPAAVTVVNVSDPSEIPRGIESPQGEQAILNVIRRNPRKIRSSF